jgi:GT2 family glycosyltransferase
VSWNGLGWLKSFLPSIAASVDGDTEIIIADNASTDGTAGWVSETFPKITVQTFDQNYGYCGGNNRAAELANGDILIFLNNDVEVNPGWLHPILQAFRTDPKLGAAQPKIRAHSDKERFEYAGAAGGMIDNYGYPFCLGRLFDTCEIDTGQYDNEGLSIFWASGAAIAVRKTLFVRSDGFDEDFLFHMEEIDLCWKIRRMGYEISCIPDSIVYHVGGGSLDAASPRKLSFNVRNNLAMLYKHLPMLTFMKVYLARLVLDTIAALRELISGKLPHFGAIIGGHIHFLRHIRNAHRKRKQLLTQGLPFRIDCMTPVLLPWQYFVQKRKTARELLLNVTKV